MLFCKMGMKDCNHSEAVPKREEYDSKSKSRIRVRESAVDLSRYIGHSHPVRLRNAIKPRRRAIFIHSASRRNCNKSGPGARISDPRKATCCRKSACSTQLALQAPASELENFPPKRSSGVTKWLEQKGGRGSRSPAVHGRY